MFWNSNSDLSDENGNRKNSLPLVMTEVTAMPWELRALATHPQHTPTQRALLLSGHQYVSQYRR